MQSIKLLYLFFLSFFTFLISPTSSAYIQYSYSADPLDLKATYVGGQSDFLGSTNRELITFSFSFEIDENELSASGKTLVNINQANITPVIKYDNPYDQGNYIFESKVRGRVEINPDKTINYWYLLFDVKPYDLYRTEQHNLATDRKVSIGSFGGTNTCNCDIFQDRLWATSQRRDWWVRAIYLDFRYGHQSSFDNWTITHTVPEANGLVLASLGLLGLLIIRRTKNVNS